ncbi:MAG: hypothetical protein R2800_03370 [Flavipsychrobacter sp.]
MYLTKEQEQLALEIAQALNDMHSIQWHRDMVAKYPESHLRECLRKALAKPEHTIRVSRGAIYNNLVEPKWTPRSE